MAIPSWYQAQISTTIPAPTKIVKDIQHVMVSTIIGSTIQTNILHASSLSSSTIQTNTLSIITLTGSTIQANTFNASTTIASTIQTNGLSFITVVGSTIQYNLLQYSTIIGCTIQTPAHDAKIIIGSSIQTNTLNLSSLIGSSIQTNTAATSSLINSTILTPNLFVSSSLGSTIHTKIVSASTVASDSIQLNNLYVSTLIGSTLVGNVFQINASNVSSASGNSIQTNILQTNTLAGSTIQTNSFIVSTINITGTNVITMNTLNVSTVNDSTIICSTIQTNKMGDYGKIVQIAGEYITFDLGTGGNYHNQYRQMWNVAVSVLYKIQFVGSNDGITWTNLGIFTPIIFENMHIFSYTLTNVRYIRLIFIEIMSGISLEDSQYLFFGLFTITYNGGTNLINYIFGRGISPISQNITQFDRWAYTDSFQIGLNSTYNVSSYPAIGYYIGSNYTDVFDINAIADINLLTVSTVQVNLLDCSTIAGSTIQADTLHVSTLLGSTFINTTIQSNTLDVSSLIGGTIQMNTLLGNIITASSIQTNQIGTSTLSGSTILMNLLDISTIICSSIHTSQIGISTITHSTIQMNTLNANMNIRSISTTEILGEYLTFDLGTGGNYHNKYSQEIGGGRNYPTKIYFAGSIDGIIWRNLGLSEGTIIPTSGIWPDLWDRISFNYTTNNYRYLRIILINIWFDYGTYEVSFINCRISNNDETNIFPTTKANIIYSQNISTAPWDTVERAYEFNIRLTTDAYYPWMYHTTGSYIGSVNTNVLDNTPYNNIIANTIIGSTIQSDTISGGILQVSTMTGSTMIGSTIIRGTIQIPQLNMSTIIGSSIIGSNLQVSKILITDGNKALSTSAVNASQLWYIAGLTSDAGGIGQINTWTHGNSFNVAPIFTGVISDIPLYTLGMIYAKRILKYNQGGGQSISGTLSENYIPYVTTGGALTNSIIYRVNATDIAIGQTTSTFPTGTGTTFTIVGLLQTLRLSISSATFSKIIMADKRSGLNGTVISDNQGCNFYIGTMNNNGTGYLSDVLYLNSWSDSSAGNVNAVMFNKNSIGMRIYQGAVGSTSNFTSYQDAVMTDVNSGNITLGQNSDTNGITFGPSASSSSYLKVGSGTTRIETNVGQIISTNGNLHIDCGTNSKSIKINASGNSSSIQLYGPYYMQSIEWITNSSQRCTVLSGGKLTTSNASVQPVFEYNSYHWMYGIDYYGAFQKQSSGESVKIRGRYGFYTRDVGWSRVTLRIYSIWAGVYKYYYFDTYTNHTWNQLVHPIDLVLNEGDIPWAGPYSIYIYCDGNSWTDSNDILWIYVTVLPGSEY